MNTPAANRVRRAAGTAIAAVLAAVTSSSAAPPETRPATAPPATRPATAPAAGPLAGRAIDTSHAWLVHVPGIAGESPIDHTLVAGLRDGGFAGPSEIFDWTGLRRGLAALMNRQKNDEQAAKLADIIVAHHKANPGDQIVLTGHSGGTGIIVFALEKLPNEAIVDGVLLLSPALSVDYDLSDALRRVRGKAYVFNSQLDVFVLGVGTKLFGTMDRRQGESAGRVGFNMPAGGDAKQYEKLVACPYEKAWEEYGNVGDHVTVCSRQFSGRMLCPLLLSNLPGSPGPLVHPAPGPATTRPATRPAATQPASKEPRP